MDSTELGYKILDHGPSEEALRAGLKISPGSLLAPHGSSCRRSGVLLPQAAALDLFPPKSSSKALWLELTCSCVFVYLHEQRSGTVRC